MPIGFEIFVCGSGTKEFITRTFAKSRKLRKVLLNEGLESVGSYSFNSCLALKEIEMPSTIDDAMAHTFWCFERADKLKVYYTGRQRSTGIAERRNRRRNVYDDLYADSEVI